MTADYRSAAAFWTQRLLGVTPKTRDAMVSTAVIQLTDIVGELRYTIDDLQQQLEELLEELRGYEDQ